MQISTRERERACVCLCVCGDCIQYGVAAQANEATSRSSNYYTALDLEHRGRDNEWPVCRSGGWSVSTSASAASPPTALGSTLNEMACAATPY